MKRLHIIITLTCITLVTFGQTSIDALRYSQNFYSGTARSQAMGNAFGALGGDFTAISINPASTGVFRKGYFSISPELNILNTNGEISLEETFDGEFNIYDGESRLEQKYNMNLANVGIVFSNDNGESSSGIVGFSFAFGYNRLNNYHNEMQMSINDNYFSLADFYAIQGIGTEPEYLDPLTSKLFYDNILTELMPGTTDEYYSLIGYNYNTGDATLFDQEYLLSTQGRLNEWVFSGGVNVAHKIYIGGSVNIQSFDYDENVKHSEIDYNDEIGNFDYFTYVNSLNTWGNGVNGKFGIIVRPIPLIRVGVAIHSSTFFRVTEEYSSYIIIDDIRYEPTDTDGYRNSIYRDKYDLATPAKLVGSLAFQLSKLGLVSFEYERVNYSKMNLNNDDLSPNNPDPNDDIQNEMFVANNFRAGMEMNIMSTSLRGGFMFYDDPLGEDLFDRFATKVFTGGIGFKFDDTFFNVAYQYLMQEDSYNYYSVTEDDFNWADYYHDLEKDNHKISATLGFRF